MNQTELGNSSTIAYTMYAAKATILFPDSKKTVYNALLIVPQKSVVEIDSVRWFGRIQYIMYEFTKIQE